MGGKEASEREPLGQFHFAEQDPQSARSLGFLFVLLAIVFGLLALGIDGMARNSPLPYPDALVRSVVVFSAMFAVGGVFWLAYGAIKKRRAEGAAAEQKPQ